MKVWQWLGVVVALAVLSGGWWWLREGSTRGPQARVERGDVSEVLWVPGWVEPVSGVVEVSTLASGVVTSMPVEVGQAVTAGQIVATLDKEVVTTRVSQARAAVQQAEANAVAVRAMMRELSAAGARSDEAAKALAKSLESSDGTSKAGTPGATGLTDAQLELLTRQLTGGGSSQLFRSERSRQDALSAADAGVKVARAQLDQAEAMLGQTEVRAPVAGIVIRRNVDVGELVGALTPVPLLAIADLSQLQVRLEVDEADVARVVAGLKGYVVTAATGQEQFPGQVEQVAYELGRRKVPIDDPRARTDTRVLEAVLKLEKPGPLKIQQRVQAAIVLSESKGVLTIPAAAVHVELGKTYVRVVGPLTSEQRPVVLGAGDGQRVEVKEGLKEGETLVLDAALSVL